MTNTQAPAHSAQQLLRCHVCGEPRGEEVMAYRSLHRVTSDCRPWPTGGRLFVCGTCGCAQKSIDSEFLREAAEIYRQYEIYYQSNGVEQAVFSGETGAARTRSSQLADQFRSNVKLPVTGRMLDIGCGNGAMLRAMSAVASGWSLVGAELNDKYRSVIEAIPRVEKLYTIAPAEIPGEFDVISLIHALEHMPKPSELLMSIRGKLKPGGMLLIQLPYHLPNPFELLVADHSWHATASSTARLLRESGYEVVSFSENWIPKELSMIGRVAGSGGALANVPMLTPQQARQAVDDRINWLHAIADQARALAQGCRVQGEKMGLFGTSIAGTFLSAELAGAAEFYVDEDPSRFNMRFADRPILHPTQVPAGSKVFVGLPRQLAEGIARRLGGGPVEYVLPSSM